MTRVNYGETKFSNLVPLVAKAIDELEEQGNLSGGDTDLLCWHLHGKGGVHISHVEPVIGQTLESSVDREGELIIEYTEEGVKGLLGANTVRFIQILQSIYDSEEDHETAIEEVRAYFSNATKVLRKGVWYEITT